VRQISFARTIGGGSAASMPALRGARVPFACWLVIERPVTDEQLDLDWIDDPRSHPLARPGALGKHSSVLAIIPHFHCEEWLGDSIESILRQTHPLDGIVVIDDGGEDPPIEIVRQFPGVTLLATTQNVGPYHISQAVIEKTRYDAYMFQDADDWSLPQRLERLLAEAERTGAEMVSCQGRRLISLEGEVVPLVFPLDVNSILEFAPERHVLMHPASVITRDLVLRAGGYGTGLRFGGDTEFEHRAFFVGRLVNIPTFEYVVRNRDNSLTSSADTGLLSPERMALRERDFQKVHENQDRVSQGLEPDLNPLESMPLTPIVHHLGPKLRGSSTEVWP
jgi:hypothetical protein